MGIMILFRVILSFGLVVLMALIGFGSAGAQVVPRPPQFVLLAFDGSSSIGMWQATRKFARDARAKGSPADFTYFISTVYYVGKPFRMVYKASGHGDGASAIGWGGNSADLMARYDEPNLADAEENEIASHAVGHWDGSAWTYDQWHDEFRQFHMILDDFFKINGVKATTSFPTGWRFPQIVGFRAPQLGVSNGLWPVLKEFNYRYDTSRVSAPNYWPEKSAVSGTWNFPLASLRIAGTGKKTLSMDYNFYVADSNALPDAANKETYKKRMLDTYLAYFEANYKGNRAPVHVGHHFSLWNGGAYWEAMQEFAMQVCGKPEVRCGTYRELADFMDGLSPDQLKAYRAGAFERGATPAITLASINGRRLDPGFELDVKVSAVRAIAGVNNSDDDLLRVEIAGRGQRNAAGGHVVLKVNGRSVPLFGGNARMRDIRREAIDGNVEIVASVVSRSGEELSRSTQHLSDAGTENETLSVFSDEDRAMLGDLPEAHFDEMNEVTER